MFVSWSTLPAERWMDMVSIMDDCLLMMDDPGD